MNKTVIKKQNIYCIGIKGVGLTMLAQFLVKQGHQVSGSDISDVFLTDKVLRASKIKVKTPFAVTNIPAQLDMIIYSSAYNKKNNVEMKFIASNPERFKNIKLLSYAAALGEVFNNHDGVAVCGSHGKTTTSAWLGYVLWKSGKKPNVLVGSRVPQFAGSGLSGASSYLIAEVDEYQNKLQYFQPRGVVLNNIDYDHPDFFKTKAAYLKVFADFLKKVPPTGFLVINNSDREIKKIKKLCRGKIISYEIASENKKQASVTPARTTAKLGDEPANYVATDLKSAGAHQSFRLGYNKKDLGVFQISLLGRHNIANALAVIAAAREMKVSSALIKKHLAGFRGTERRAQILGSYQGATIIDDYAHHPTEIKATLAGLISRYPKRHICAVFHPHTFTRTKALFKDFVSSFSEVDELIILDIYGSAREKQGGVSSRELAMAITKFNQLHNIKQAIHYIPSIAQVVTYLRRQLVNEDILLLIGAGDVFRVAENLLKKVKKL